MDEKRKSVRLSIDIPVKIRYNGISTPGKSRNLSCGGIFIQTPQSLPKEEPCELILALPDGRPPMVIQSEVVWREPDLEELECQDDSEAPEAVFESDYDEQEDLSEDDLDDVSPMDSQAGVEFSNLDTDQKERLNEFICRNIREDVH